MTDHAFETQFLLHTLPGCRLLKNGAIHDPENGQYFLECRKCGMDSWFSSVVKIYDKSHQHVEHVINISDNKKRLCPSCFIERYKRKHT